MTEHDEQLAAHFDAGVQRRSERREFFRTALGAAAVTAVGAAAVTIGSTAMAQTTADMDILNFALNLEYLEAQFYAFAATGAGLPASQLTGTNGTAGTTGTPGAVSGGRQVAFTDPLVANYAREIAADEAAHVAFLRTTLGSAAVAQPALDIGSTATGAFSVAARAAGLIGAGAAFDPYASDENFLLAAFIFEDVGVTAYKGAAALLSSKAYLDAAAGLLGVEAYHASIIRTTLYAKGIATPSLRTSADAISNARDRLDGTSDDDQGISPAALTAGTAPLAPALQGQVASNIVPTGADGLAYGRTPGTVLNIVYLNSAAVSSGGFFPAGLNGIYKTSAAN